MLTSYFTALSLNDKSSSQSQYGHITLRARTLMGMVLASLLSMLLLVNF